MFCKVAKRPNLVLLLGLDLDLELGLGDLNKDLAQGLGLDLDLGLGLGPSRNQYRPDPRSRPGSLPRSELPNNNIIAPLASP